MNPSHEHTGTPMGALHALVLNLFTAEEFRRWLRHGPDADIVPELPGEAAADATVVDKALGALERRGRIDATFFVRLKAERERRSDTIAAVASLWASSTGPSPAGERPGLHPGDVLGDRYRLVGEVGQGGVGQVWRATDQQSGDTVAVKVLNPDGVTPDPDRRGAFFRGAQAMARLVHPAIARVRDPRPDPENKRGPHDFYVMDFIEAPNLSVSVKGAPRSDAETIEILIALGEGLAAAHRRQVIHRDLKPSNVLYEIATRRVFIVDFDTVKDLEDLTMTRSGGRLASTLYASPEVLLTLSPMSGGEATRVDVRADIFSLAVIGVFLRTGRDPSHNFINRMSEYIAAIECAEGLRRVLVKGCAFAADERHASVDEFVAALRREQLNSSATVIVPLPTGDTRRPAVWPPLPLPSATVLLKKVNGVSSKPGRQWRPSRQTVFLGTLVLVFLVMVGLAFREVRSVAPCPEGTKHIKGTHGSLFEREGAQRDIADFCLDITEVTVAAFREKSSAESYAMSRTQLWPGKPRGEGNQKHCNARHTDRDRHPMNCVDWEQASAYCAAIGGRLPSEWEWEWAARGREEERVYPWGSEAPDCERAIYSHGAVSGCGEDRTWEVGSRRGALSDSLDGLKDMSGNVWEWTSSAYRTSDDLRTVRGGGWLGNTAEDLRAAFRDGIDPKDRTYSVGFRCASTL